MNVLIIRPEDDTKKGWWTVMECLPHKGEQMYFMGKSYDISMVKYFMGASDIKEYNGKTPFARIMLMNQ